MKKLILFILPFSLSAESNITYDNYDYSYSVDREIKLDTKVNLFKLISTFTGDVKARAEEMIKNDFLAEYINHQNKIISNKMIILQHKQELEESELEMLKKTQKIKEDFHAREMLIAKFFHESVTGKLEGRSWFDLTDNERKQYRDNFYRNHSQYTKR